jgi:hypothetical protein
MHVYPQKCIVLETGNTSLVELLSTRLIAALEKHMLRTWGLSRGRAISAILRESLVKTDAGARIYHQ